MSGVKISTFLSYVLRHKPESIGLVLDHEGWAEASEIIAKSDMPITQAEIEDVVATSDNQRFALSEDKQRIRAKGHSIKVNPGLEAVAPPAQLFHALDLSSRFWRLACSGKRQHMHLTADLETASKVGVRHGKLAIFEVKALEMHQQGHHFYRSKNGVWLVEHVPASFLELR